MNTKSLNRAIGLAMSALQQARANNSSDYIIDLIKHALTWLNKARARIKQGEHDLALLYATTARAHISRAIALR